MKQFTDIPVPDDSLYLNDSLDPNDWSDDRAMTQRVCFVLSIRKDRIEEYRARHAAVWPEMRAALRETGWSNYSLFLSDEGLLVGYLECDDFEAARAAMAARDVNARWQAEMAGFFDGIAGAADENMRPLPEIFHLS